MSTGSSEDADKKFLGMRIKKSNSDGDWMGG